MHKVVLIIVISILLTSFLPISLAIPTPVGVGGKITVDGEPIIINVTITNVDTGETHTKTTNGNGFYACAMSGSEGDKIKITVEYDGTHSNFTYVDLNKTTQWLNLSIEINDSGGEGSSDSSPSPPPPPPPPSYSPHADFTVIPSNPKVNESVAFVSISTDPDDDIINYTWNIEGQLFYGQMHEHVFRASGNYDITLIVTDSMNNIAVAQKTIHVAPISTQEQQSNTPETNNTQNQTNETESNITISIIIKDKNNNTLPNTPVYIYDENDTLVQTTYTNDTGMAQVTLSSGSYRIKAYYGTQTETKRMEFMSDGRVVFLFNPEETQPSREEGFNWWLVVIPLILISAMFVVWWWRKSKKWW